MAVQFLDRSIKLPTTPDELQSRFVEDEWLMTDAERSALAALLDRLRPKYAIEVGTYKAGSLGVIAEYCEHVYSLDRDPACRDSYDDRFPNTDFLGPLRTSCRRQVHKINTGN